MKSPMFTSEAYLTSLLDAGAQSYFVDFENDSDHVWTMALFQTYPDSVGLESVAWLQARAANGGESGVKWDVDYQAMLADYAQSDGRGVYKASQKKTTLLGKKWKVTYENGLQQLFEDGSADRPDQIVIANQSGERANLGIGMSGNGAVFKRNVYSGAGAQFIVKPTYWLGLFNDVVRGEVISSNVVVGPKQLVFEDGKNAATVVAYIKGDSIAMDIKYSTRSTTQVRAIDEHIKALEQRAHLIGDRSTSGTLKVGASHPWKKNEYTKLSFDWADRKAPGTGTCSVKIGDAAQSYTVPQANLEIDNREGKLTNNTTATISYTLS